MRADPHQVSVVCVSRTNSPAIKLQRVIKLRIYLSNAVLRQTGRGLQDFYVPLTSVCFPNPEVPM